MKEHTGLLRNDKGIVIIYVALGLVMFLGFVALAVDTGFVMVTRTELQRTADAAALAGARTLGRLYECNGDLSGCPRAMSYEDQQTYEPDAGAIKSAATAVALQNQAGGSTSGIIINASDITIGNWDGATRTLTPVTFSPNAVRVTARRDTAANGPIQTFFARIFGVMNAPVSATATAALTGQTTAEPGSLSIPAAININWLNSPSQDWCNQNITFHPSSADVCAAWHSYDGAQYQPTGSGERRMIEDMTAGNYESPETIAGQTQFNFTNGSLATVFTHNTMQDLFNTMKIRNDGVLDRDEDPATWTTGIAVYNSTACNPSGLIPIAAFVTITITNVSAPPVSTIFATVRCNEVVSGRGGGNDYGTLGSIPGLVE